MYCNELPETSGEKTILLKVSKGRGNDYGCEWRKVCIRHMPDSWLQISSRI
jgi:hypothetical protein